MRFAWPQLPMLEWGRGYGRDTLLADGLAAVIVTIMLIPQSLAYALLAGLPAQAGLYASVLPLVVYAIFGSSRVLAVGPVAVVSLMTAAAIGDLATAGSPAYWTAALTLAAFSGLILLAMGLLRLGFLASFLSHPVISGFITASAILIAASQLKVVLGIRASGQTLPQIATALASRLGELHWLTLAIGVASTAFLFWARRRLQPALQRLGLGPEGAGMAAKAGPIFVIIATTFGAWWLDWGGHGVQLVGSVPRGLPPFTLPSPDPAVWQALAPSALLIAIVGFVESVSVGQTLAARRRERIAPDQELVALGGANLSAAFTGGMPVTGGFSRSIVNFDAGARTPLAGVLTAIGLLIASLTLTPALHFLPQATLAATIIVAVLSLVDVATLRRTWRYSKADFAAVAATIIGTLGLGVERGLVAGVALSLLLHLARAARPHIAEVGLVPGTEHFRNVTRHHVLTCPQLLGLRVDESLQFTNARVLEDRINAEVAQRPALRHLVLQCSAINAIDASALESLEAINERLRKAGIRLHLSEVKGPVMDRLQRSDFLQKLSGQVFLSHHQAVAALAPEVAAVGL